MLIMIKEIVGNDLVDRTINPAEVLSVESLGTNNSEVQATNISLIEMIGGKVIRVKGTVAEITARLNSKRLLKG